VVRAVSKIFRYILANLQEWPKILCRYTKAICKIHKNMLYSTYTYRRKMKLRSSDADCQSANDKNTQIYKRCFKNLILRDFLKLRFLKILNMYLSILKTGMLS
jgi:hypothetical protein